MSSTNKKSPAQLLALRSKTTTNAVQPKVTNSVVNHKPPVAPPVYRPQPVPKVLQTKRSPAHNLPASKALAARPVSHPETKEVVQPKVVSQQRQSPTAPPAYRPVQPRIAQPRMATLTQPGHQKFRALTGLRSGSVVQGMMERKREDSSDDEEAPNLNVRGDYPTIKGDDPWNDVEAMIKHCITYCGGSDEKLTWVKFAYIVGAPPPELGHGSQAAKPQQGKKKQGKGGGKQGSAKDIKRWQSFQTCMESVIEERYDDVKGSSPFQKAQKIVKGFNGKRPAWWA
jgi:hypothetical protein